MRMNFDCMQSAAIFDGSGPFLGWRFDDGMDDLLSERREEEGWTPNLDCDLICSVWNARWIQS